MRQFIHIIEAADAGQIWYHGTTADFDRFEAQEDSHLGFHFGTQQQAARIIKKKPGGRIDAYRLDFTNPLRCVDAGDWSNVFQAWVTVNKALKGKIGDPLKDHALMIWMADTSLTRQEKLAVLRQKVMDLGYDAIIYKNRIEGSGDSVMVFGADQIERQPTR